MTNSCAICTGLASVFILHSEIRTNLSYGHPLIPRRLDKTVQIVSYYSIHTPLPAVQRDWRS